MGILFREVDTARLSNVTGEVPDGFVVGVIGETGCGADDLLALARGTLAPLSGSVDVGGASPLVLDRPFALDDAVSRELQIAQLNCDRRRGAPVLLYSHDEALIERLCDEVWWIDGGRIAHRGAPGETLARYRRHVAARLRSTSPVPDLAPVVRRGDGRAELLVVEALDADGHVSGVWRSGAPAAARVEVLFHAAVDDPVVGVLIRTRIGADVYGTNTQLEGIPLGPVAAGERLQITFHFVCALCPQEYTITAASHDPDGVWHDWVEEAIAVAVTGDRYTAGVANLRAAVDVVRK